MPVPPARFVFGNSKAVLLTVPDLTETSNLFLVSRVPYASFFDKTVPLSFQKWLRVPYRSI